MTYDTSNIRNASISLLKKLRQKIFVEKLNNLFGYILLLA
ncbi:MAG: hypothetical protein JWQ25_1001, partial [Daejeonella sp.]|nr:hypothetical protein [Daejeonella sp.]